MTYNNDLLRFPAEWEHSDAILVSWPHKDTDWGYMLDEVTDCYVRLVRAITDFMPVVIVAPDCDVVRKALRAEKLKNKVYLYEVETNDTWARDFGPITLLDESGTPVILDFKFNAWGMKFAADKDNLVTSALYGASALRGEYQNHLGFVLEGGSIETDGNGLLMTTSECLLSPNRNGDKNKEEIEQYLKNALNVKKVLWIDYGFLLGDDTDSHVDTLARLAPDNTIIFVKCDDESDPHYDALHKMERCLKDLRNVCGEPFNLVSLPLPDAVLDYEDGSRLPATYANYLVTEKAVFIPVYGQDKDEVAVSRIQKVFKHKKCVTVDCNALIRQHGSLHCATMQIFCDFRAMTQNEL